MSRQSIRAAAALAVALASAGCAHRYRYPIPQGGEREAVAGVPIAFEAPGPVPGGTQLSWDFGDGSPALAGTSVEHAFARAGDYQVALRVQDRKGSREAAYRVHVQRRSPASALPPSARWALILDRLFARAPEFATLGARLAGPERAAGMLAGLQRVLGFDVSEPAAVLESGIDPDVGVAVGSLPEDPGTWIAVGITDGEAALARLVRVALTQSPVITVGPGLVLQSPFGGGELLAFVHQGFLYLHLGQSGEPVAREAIVQAPLEGLLADRAFASARARVEGTDAFLFATVDAFPLEIQARIPEDLVHLFAHATGLAVGVALREGEADLSGLLTLDAQGPAELAQVVGTAVVGSLGALAPPGAVAFASIPLDPGLARRLFLSYARELARPAPVPNDVLSLANLLTGGFGAAFYFDAAGLYRDIAAGETPSPRFLPMVGLGITDPDAAGALLRRVQSLPSPVEGRTGAWASVGRGGQGAIVVTRDAMVVGAGAPVVQSLLEDSSRPRLAEALRDALPESAPAPGHLLAFVDLGRAIDSLRDPPPIPGVGEARRRMLAATAASALDQSPQLRPLTQMRDVLLDAWPAEDALQAQLRVRFR